MSWERFAGEPSEFRNVPGPRPPSQVELHPAADGWVDLHHRTGELIGSLLRVDGGFLLADALGNEVGTYPDEESALDAARRQ